MEKGLKRQQQGETSFTFVRINLFLLHHQGLFMTIAAI